VRNALPNREAPHPAPFFLPFFLSAQLCEITEHLGQHLGAPFAAAATLSLVLISTAIITTLRSALTHRGGTSAIGTPVTEHCTGSVNKLPADLPIGGTDEAKVVYHRMILHVNKVPTWACVLRAATIAIVITAGVRH